MTTPYSGNKLPKQFAGNSPKNLKKSCHSVSVKGQSHQITVYRSDSGVVGLDWIRIRIADSKPYFKARFWIFILIPHYQCCIHDRRCIACNSRISHVVCSSVAELMVKKL